jgi:hypothetical protein
VGKIVRQWKRRRRREEKLRARHARAKSGPNFLLANWFKSLVKTGPKTGSKTGSRTGRSAKTS